MNGKIKAQAERRLISLRFGMGLPDDKCNTNSNGFYKFIKTYLFVQVQKRKRVLIRSTLHLIKTLAFCTCA